MCIRDRNTLCLNGHCLCSSNLRWNSTQCSKFELFFKLHFDKNSTYKTCTSIIASLLTFNEVCVSTFGDPCQIEENGLRCTDGICVCEIGFKWDNQTNKCSISLNYLSCITFYNIYVIISESECAFIHI